MGGPATKKPRLTIERPCPLARLLRSPDRRDVVQPGRGIYGRHLLGGFGGTSLVVGVRWPFRGKDAGSPNSGQLLGRLRTRPRGGQRGPTAQTRFRQALLVPEQDADALAAVNPRDRLREERRNRDHPHLVRQLDGLRLDRV